ncbi:MAG: hypothetical protein INR62_00935 [Rhodospirillales bacterium]|nr:hypothetical protein [Acetobacter sp.]
METVGAGQQASPLSRVQWNPVHARKASAIQLRTLTPKLGRKVVGRSGDSLQKQSGRFVSLVEALFDPRRDFLGDRHHFFQ